MTRELFLIFLTCSVLIIDCGGQVKRSKKKSSFECGVQEVEESSLNKNGPVVKYEHPWKVAILHKRRDVWEFLCNGVLINEKIVLTVAHCIHGKGVSRSLAPGNIKAVLGANNLTDVCEPGRVEKFIESIKIHGDWNITNNEDYDGDIAILKLTENVEFNRYVRPVCLPNKKILTTSKGELSGWWLGNDERLTDNAQKVQLNKLTHVDCIKKSPTLINALHERTFCAGHEDVELKRGESGGGFYYKLNGKFHLRGLISAAVFNFNSPNHYASYVEVFKYLKFLEENGVPTIDLDEITIRPNIENCGSPSSFSGLSTGGSEIRRGSYPWLAAIFKKIGKETKYICGGTLISAGKIVTAAHCIFPKHSPSATKSYELRILLGAHDISDFMEPNTQRPSVEEIIIHETWNPQTDRFTGDIAVLRLSEPVTFTNYVKPICISDKVGLENEGIVGGWGITENGTVSDVARAIRISTVDPKLCYEKENILAISGWDKSFCAGRTGVNVCEGDSGSGFFVEVDRKFYLKGIVSSAITVDFCAKNNLAMFSDATKYIEFFNVTVNNDQ